MAGPPCELEKAVFVSVDFRVLSTENQKVFIGYINTSFINFREKSLIVSKQ